MSSSLFTLSSFTLSFPVIVVVIIIIIVVIVVVLLTRFSLSSPRQECFALCIQLSSILFHGGCMGGPIILRLQFIGMVRFVLFPGGTIAIIEFFRNGPFFASRHETHDSLHV